MHFGFPGRLRSCSSCYKQSFVKSEIKTEMSPSFNLGNHLPELLWFREHGFGWAHKLQKNKSPTHFLTWYKLCWLKGVSVWFTVLGMPRHDMREFLQQRKNNNFLPETLVKNLPDMQKATGNLLSISPIQPFQRQKALAVNSDPLFLGGFTC